MVVVAVLTGLTVAACYIAQAPPSRSEAGVNLDLPTSVGRFWGTERQVSEAEKVILPGDTEFAKKEYSDGLGNTVNCQIVLAGAEKRSIHRPEICLPAQGWTLKSGEVIPVTLSDGKTMEVMKLRISRPTTLPDGKSGELSSVFLYWFVGKDITTPSHIVRLLKTNLDMLLHNVNHRWAYVIVSAPVMEGLVPGGKNEAQTLEIVKQFVGEIAPKIIRHDQ